MTGVSPSGSIPDSLVRVIWSSCPGSGRLRTPPRARLPFFGRRGVGGRSVVSRRCFNRKAVARMLLRDALSFDWLPVCVPSFLPTWPFCFGGGGLEDATDDSSSESTSMSTAAYATGSLLSSFAANSLAEFEAKPILVVFGKGRCLQGSGSACTAAHSTVRWELRRGPRKARRPSLLTLCAEL